MQLREMVVEVVLAFPFFNKMEHTGIAGIGKEFVPAAPGFLPHYLNDLFGLPDKIALPARQKRTSRIDKQHTNPFFPASVRNPARPGPALFFEITGDKVLPGS